ncbi:MAG: family 10 glycosylhydrolase [Aphanothece sp. CMT-3BRIN-NPC111]|jgi:uncharacterized lipoprotein YddW (UPF0748 family)|nr:family 10 glycosylhydrolase [Aphanothece sp. CMT-3BRIN-NPC111]
MLKRSLTHSFTTCADKLVSFSRTSGRQAWFIFLVAFSLTITIWLPTASYSQTALNDIQGHWAQPCIQQLVQRQIISGYPDGTFKPNSSVTRAEFAVLAGKAFPNAPVVRSGSNFADIPSNYWAKDAIARAYRAGFLSGYPGQMFKPNEKIPRVQVLVSLASGLKYSPAQPVAGTLNAAFADASAIPDYGRNAIAAATEKQLVVNYPNVRTLNPNQQATRGEVAAFICQALGNSGVVPSQYIAKVGTPATQAKEIRGVWLTNIDSDVLFNSDRLSAGVQRLDELNFNTLYPAVWNCSYTLYPSAVAERVIGRSVYPEAGLERRDMLKELVTQGHQKGMAVIPWFEFGFMATADSGVPQCNPASDLAKRHPDWLTSRSDGSTIWKEGSHDRVWLNPLRPEVQQFIKDLVVEVVTKYDIDGIQFDDHFGFPAEFGYDPFTVGLYKQEHAGKSPPSDFKNAEWTRWRADKITAVMKQLFQAVKERKKNVLVSLSPNPQEFSYESYLADWQSWERQGIIEELVIQLYRNDLSRLIAEMDRPEVQAARRHIPVAIGILSGLKPRPIPMQQIQEQVQAVRDRGFAGVSFFFYESLWNLASEPAAQRQAAFKQLFSTPVERPNIVEGWQPTA